MTPPAAESLTYGCSVVNARRPVDHPCPDLDPGYERASIE
jgi:hypothetical protein